MMIYLEAFDNLCFHWRLGLPKKDGHMLWTKKLKTRDARFQNKHLHCSSVLELKFFGGPDGLYDGWVPSLELTASLPPENRPLSLPQKESGSSHSHHVFLICYLCFRILDSFRECRITNPDAPYYGSFTYING